MENRKAKIGVLLIGAKRFHELGIDTADGTYAVRKEKEASKILDSFKEAGELVFSGIVYEKTDVDKAIKVFFEEKVDCVVAAFLSWAEDFAWIRFLREMPEVPILFTSIIRDSVDITDTNDENQFIDFLSAGSLVGVQEGSGDFARFGRKMSKTCIGLLPDVTKELVKFAAASKVRMQLRSSNVGLLACFNEAMWTTYMDPYNMFFKVGPEIRYLSIAELEDEVEKITDEELQKVTEEMKKNFTFYNNVDYAKFEASVRASMAMEKLGEKYELDLMALNDIDPVLFAKIGLRPGFWPTNPENKLAIVPEGDLGNGLSTYILRLLSGKHANFIEPFYIINQRGTFAAGHAGPNDYREKPENTIVARDERFAKTKNKYAGAPFAWYVFPEGRKTMLHMSEKDGRMKMVCTEIDCVKTNHYLASYSHAEFKHPTLTPEELFGKLIEIGVNQHYGIVDGNYIAELEQLAKLLDFDFYYIK